MRGLFRVIRPALLLAIVIGVGTSTREVGAQTIAGSGYASSYRTSDYFIAPGWYGTSYGFASYGMPQTYSVFSAYPGTVLRRRTTRRMACCRGVTGSASGGPDTSHPVMSTGPPIIPRPAFSYRTFPVMYGTAGRPMDPAPPHRRTMHRRWGPRPLRMVRFSVQIMDEPAADREVPASIAHRLRPPSRSDPRSSNDDIPAAGPQSGNRSRSPRSRTCRARSGS